MTDATTKILADRIGAIIERVKDLAGERDEYVAETDALRSRAEAGEREQSRLRSVLLEAARELRQE